MVWIIFNYSCETLNLWRSFSAVSIIPTFDTFNFSGCLLPTHTTLMYGVFFIMPYNYTLMVGVAWNVDRRFEHFRSNASDVPKTFCKYLLRFTKRLLGIFSVIQLLLSLKTLNRSCLSVR